MNRIRMSESHYEKLRKHLYPGDGLEAVAIALCGRSVYESNHTLLVQELLLVPYEKCFERRPDLVHWPTDIIDEFLVKATQDNLAILKIHCHPGGYEQFSKIDDHSDNQLFKSIGAWLDNDLPHASCIMLPDGRIFGRFFDSNLDTTAVDQIFVSGSDIMNWHYLSANDLDEQLHIRNMQVFGKQTIALLSKMRIGIVGCSGTGSPVIEQLKRYGVGELVLVDPDFVDKLNLNRIIGSTLNDAENKTLKVVVMEREIKKVGFGSNTICLPLHVTNKDVVKSLAECDVIISCVDSSEARHILNLISTLYLIPLLDLGVKIDVAHDGTITGIFGSVHYIKPGGSSLLSRGQYNMESVRAEGIRRVDKEEFLRNQYLSQVGESSPAVISINMQVASTAINELLARIHPYRNFGNRDCDVVRIMFSDCTTNYESDSLPCGYFTRLVGKGDISPLLNNPELSS